MVSIVILTLNQLTYTKECVDSILSHTTPGSFELVFVDNGSTDGTLEFLESLSNRPSPPWTRIEVIRNGENRGFAGGCNQGIRASLGDDVLLLNNDVLVTPGWLDRLVTALRSNPKAAMAGPVSNYVIESQRAIPDCAPEDYLKRALSFHEKNKGTIFEVANLSGFCLLIARELIEAVGLLDESFQVGGGEDNDYCYRARLAGYVCMVAADTFVFHHGSKTFEHLGLDHGTVQDQNMQGFSKKWNIPYFLSTGKSAHEPIEPGVFLDGTALVPEIPEGITPLAPSGTRISLCMIVKNEASSLPRCLESVRGVVDEVVIVDTGSDDSTIELARQYGARVVEIPWNQDFSEARNVSLSHAGGDWILILDADEVLDLESFSEVRKIAQEGRPGVYKLRIRNLTELEGDLVDQLGLRFFARDPNLYFSGKIHEQLLHRVEAAEEFQRKQISSNIQIYHYGYLDEVYKGREKGRRNIDILEKAVSEEPENPFHHFNLGVAYSKDGRLEEAIRALESAAQLCPTHMSFYPLIHIHAARAWLCLKRGPEAIASARKAVKAAPDLPDSHYLLGESLVASGKTQEAIAAYEKAIQCRNSRTHHISTEKGLSGWRAYNQIGAIYASLKDWEHGADYFQRALSENPENHHLLCNLARAFAERGNLEEAWRCYRKAYDKDPVIRGVWIELVKIGRLLNKDEETLSVLRDLNSRFPQNPYIVLNLADILAKKGAYQEALSQYDYYLGFSSNRHAVYPRALCLFYLGKYAEAERDFTEAIRYFPELPDIHNNLAACAMRTGRHSSAREHLNKALSMSPDYRPAILNMAGLAEKEGNHDQVLSLTARISPEDAGYRDALLLASGAHLALNRRQEALEGYTRLLELEPHDPFVFERIGTVLTELGLFSQALESYETALRLRPGFPEALLGLRALEAAILAQSVRSQNLSSTQSPPPPNLPPQPSPGPSHDPPPAPKTLSLCMIVRDEEKTLQKCLDSVRGVVDEIVIVDTGSTDRTRDIAREAGARILESPWENDFSKARNVSLQAATGDWILVLDADERLDSESSRIIRGLLNVSLPCGYVVRIRNTIHTENQSEVLDHRTTRLFPRSQDIFFEGTIHEQVVQRILHPGGKESTVYLDRMDCDLLIHHEGYERERVESKQKDVRNIELLKAALDREPDNAFHYFNLGNNYLLLSEYDLAIQSLREAARLSTNNAVYRTAVHYDLALTYNRLGRFSDGLKEAETALTLSPYSSDAHFAAAEAFHGLGKLENALDEYTRAVECRDHPEHCLVASDRGTSGWKAHNHKGLIYAELKKFCDAERAFKEALSENPEHGGIWFNLALSLKSQGKLSEAQEALERSTTIQQGLLSAHTELLSVYVARDLLHKAQSLVDARRSDPHFHLSLSYHLGRLLLEKGRPAEALPHHDTFLESFPDDFDARFNRSVCYLALNRKDEACRDLMECVRLNPQSAIVLNNLGVVGLIEKDFAKAETEFRRAIEIDENCHSAILNLARVCFARKDYEEARKWARKIPPEHPEHGDAVAIGVESCKRLGESLALQAKWVGT
ncbi:MAG: tetratricopeptide repeat protein [Armatimonadetes bacterium]|nr:tetratricopeptide repeat protein [Armatimonadota bacterium]